MVYTHHSQSRRQNCKRCVIAQILSLFCAALWLHSCSWAGCHESLCMYEGKMSANLTLIVFLSPHSFRSSSLTGRCCWPLTGVWPRRASLGDLALITASSNWRRNTGNCPTWQPHAGKNRVSLVSLPPPPRRQRRGGGKASFGFFFLSFFFLGGWGASAESLSRHKSRRVWLWWQGHWFRVQNRVSKYGLSKWECSTEFFIFLMIASEISKGSTKRKNSSNPKERFHPNHLRFKLITHDNPQRLLVVSSPCDCTKKHTLAVAHFETQKAKLNVNHVWLDATPSLVQRMRWWKFHVGSAATLRDEPSTASAWLEFGHGNEMEHIKCQQEACSSCQGICGVKGALSLFREVMLLTARQQQRMSSKPCS